MSDAAQYANVVDMGEYLTETLHEFDVAIATMLEQRDVISLRLAAIRAATSLAVVTAEQDFISNTESNRPYAGEDTAALIAEAHRRFVR